MLFVVPGVVCVSEVAMSMVRDGGVVVDSMWKLELLSDVVYILVRW